MDKNASSSSQIIIYLGIVVVAGIGFVWFMAHFWNVQSMFETVNNDILALSMQINGNCDANYHYFSYNPRTEDGNLIFSAEEICIRTEELSKCAKLYCGPGTETIITLKSIVYVKGERDGILEITGE